MEANAKSGRREFLDVTTKENEFDLLLQEFSQPNIQLNWNPGEKQPEVKGIKPTPGFCIKAKAEHNSKVFINICHCTDLPKPRDLTDAELLEILASDEPSSFRVPMSLGEPHTEQDKSGQECTCYDVIVNSEYYESIKTNELFRRFLITVSYEGIQDKYGVNIDGESCIILKNKNYHGVMPDHHIRCKPNIVDLGSSPYITKSSVTLNSNKPEISRTKDVEETICPQYVLRKTPATGSPKSLVLEVQLPNVVSSKTMHLSVGEDRVVLFEKENLYEIDIFLPFLIIQEKCKAEFNICEKVLALDMPVSPDTDEK